MENNGKRGGSLRRWLSHDQGLRWDIDPNRESHCNLYIRVKSGGINSYLSFVAGNRKKTHWNGPKVFGPSRGKYWTLIQSGTLPIIFPTILHSHKMLRFASLELPSFLGVEPRSSETPFPYWESSEDPLTFDASSQPSTLYSEELPFFLDESSPQRSPKKREGKVTTIQEYTQLVMNCMKCGQDMTTTEVARKIMDKVKPKPFSLTVNIRRRVGDALSVLNAIHKVSKTKRGYVWNDNQSSSDSNPNHHSTCNPSTGTF